MGDPIKSSISSFESLENWNDDTKMKVPSFVFLLTVDIIDNSRSLQIIAT